MRLLCFLLISCAWLNISFAAGFDSSIRNNKYLNQSRILENYKTGWEQKQRVLKDLKNKAGRGDEDAFVVLLNYDMNTCYLFVDEHLNNSALDDETHRLFLDHLDKLAVKGHRHSFRRILGLNLSRHYPFEGMSDRRKTIKFLVDFLVNDVEEDALVLVGDEIVKLGGYETFVAESQFLVDRDLYKETIEENLRAIRNNLIEDCSPNL